MASVLALAVPLTGHAQDASSQLRFSNAAPGTTLPEGWKPYALSRHVALANIAVVSDAATNVLEIDANKASGSIVHMLDMPGSTQLAWRWKVDHSVAAADMRKKSGDDFAARVYVFFDLPSSALSFGERLKLRIARSIMGFDLPKAALCYVWDNSHPVGTIVPNPYYSGVRMIVLESGNANAGQWRSERRDLGADFRAAFRGAAPRVTGVALASDTDNTASDATAWFGDLSLDPTPLPSKNEVAP